MMCVFGPGAGQILPLSQDEGVSLRKPLRPAFRDQFV